MTLNSLSLPGPAQKSRVIVAMSGGVDSSVVAALLKSQGYDVIGITLQLYDHGQAVGRKGACCAGQDIHDARQVADALNIPHYVLDYEKRFASSVIDPFADSYISGETPIPCVTCNQTVKFKNLLDTTRELGASVLATGHYVRSKQGPEGWELYLPEDKERDQSYFLFATTRAQLDMLRFPLGDITKSETRALAEKFSLKIADKSDSQDICFVPTGNYAQIIERLRPTAAEAGDIIDINGEVLGQHKGIINYTVGQRRGLGIAASEPLYVVRLNAKERQVIVGPRDYLQVNWIELRDFNWLGDGDFMACAQKGQLVDAKIRSTMSPEPATLMIHGGVLGVHLHCGEEGVSPGQACIVYDSYQQKGRILGGGWIKSAKHVAMDFPYMHASPKNVPQTKIHPPAVS